jgi:sulfite reductase (NADPH) flavoprotein alpha-component
MFKKTFFQIHWFLGITAGLILSLMGVTGAIYSYEQQILKWINQESYVVEVQQQPKLTPAELYTHFSKQDPEIKINSISIAAEPSSSSTVNIVKEGARRGYNMMVNPYTAEVLPDIKGREFFQFIQQLHRNLTVGPVGKQITGACTLILIFFVLSGLYLRWPKRHTIKQWFAVKPQLKGRNFIWDLHAVVGTWVIIFYLVLACTGLYWSYDWWRSGMFKVLGVERPQAQMQEQKAPRTNPSAQGKSAAHTDHQKQNRSKQDHKDSDNSISNQQISTALNQSWTAFSTEYDQRYSTATFDIPKKANGELKISFTDVKVQHERARNNAIYLYEKQKFTDIELYEDKKLNEKIMSSMLPVHRGSFFGPIYQFAAMLASLAMPLFFITGWMLYLKRRKQKQLTALARRDDTNVALDPNATPWLICYATQTGVSEQLAWRTASSLKQAAQPVSVKALQHLTAEELTQAPRILFVVSTYGTGEAPDLALNFEKKIMALSLNLQHMEYAVLALGSMEYPDSFCHFGQRLDTWMSAQGASTLFDICRVNNASEKDIQIWFDHLAQASDLQLQDQHVEKSFDHWTLSHRECLNPESLGLPAYQVDLKTTADVTWQAGDIAEIKPGNSLLRIQQFAQQHQIELNDTLMESLLYKDLTQPFNSSIELTEAIAALAMLPSREYSIASVPEQQCLRLIIRQQKDAVGELGLGSGWLTAHTAVEQNVRLRVRQNPSFHLIDDNRPIICIGNGTGIAGLMSLLQARHRLNYTENWLIFGERQRAHDYFFEETLNIWLNMGTLKHLDVVFSRDQAEKIYVHHALSQHTERLKQWLSQGAVIYICGSIQGMATDVHNSLIEILGEDQLESLRQEGRYRRDVY